MCERIDLVWGQAHAGLGVRSTERSQCNGPQRTANVYNADWTGDYHDHEMET